MCIDCCRLSASCVHVSALLHALVQMCCKDGTPILTSDDGAHDEDEKADPVTSLACRWIQPRKQKEEVLKMSDAQFKKLRYDKPSKDLTSIASFDPRPPEYRGNAIQRLPGLLQQLKGKGLCVSLLFDPDTIVTNPESFVPLSKKDMEAKISEFKGKLVMSEEAIRQLETETKAQRNSPKWFQARQFRVTASLFGLIKRMKADTSPKNVVLQILGVKKIYPTSAMQWGIEQEEIALQQYVHFQHAHNHSGLFVCNSGIHISKTHPFLGASPDGCVYDPEASEPYGFLEIKCPYSHRDKTPLEACSDASFCCQVQGEGGTHVPVLKRNHPYYAQVQGHMAIGERMWCDFVVYTLQGISVQRIAFDKLYWETMLLPKLDAFWHKCVAPEIIQPVTHLGLPLRDLRKE